MFFSLLWYFFLGIFLFGCLFLFWPLQFQLMSEQKKGCLPWGKVKIIFFSIFSIVFIYKHEEEIILGFGVGKWTKKFLLKNLRISLQESEGRYFCFQRKTRKIFFKLRIFFKKVRFYLKKFFPSLRDFYLLIKLWWKYSRKAFSGRIQFFVSSSDIEPYYAGIITGFFLFLQNLWLKLVDLRIYNCYSKSDFYLFRINGYFKLRLVYLLWGGVVFFFQPKLWKQLFFIGQQLWKRRKYVENRL